MKLFTRMAALVLAGTLSLCLLTGCQNQAGSSSSSADNVPEVVDVATINDICLYLSGLNADEVVAKGEDIQLTAGELMYWIAINCDSMRSYYYYYYGMDQLPWDASDGEGEITMSDFVLDESMKYAAIQRLVATKGGQEGFAPTQENMDGIQAAVDTMQAEASAAGTSLQTLLFQQGLTEDLFRWNCESDYIYETLSLAKFGPDSPNPPTEESIIALREAQGEYKVKHILLATVDTTTRAPLDEATAAQKKEQAQLLWDQLSNSPDLPGDFDKLMREYSEDPGLATNPDGYTFSDEDTASLDPAFDEAAKALKEGEMSGIVEGVSGYHIILRLPLSISLEEDAQVYINTKMSQLTDEWLEQAGMKTTKAFFFWQASATDSSPMAILPPLRARPSRFSVLFIAVPRLHLSLQCGVDLRVHLGGEGPLDGAALSGAGQTVGVGAQIGAPSGLLAPEIQ